jgi:GntR family transcriptional regulator
VLIAVDPSDPRPLFEQVAAAVRLAIVRGEASPGERLPTARDLAEALDVNVNTVLHAYRDLRAEGLVDLHRGRGASVSTRSAQDYAQLRERVAQVRAEADRLGVSPATVAAMLTEEDS